MNTWSLKTFLLLVTFCLTLYQGRGNFVSLTVEGGVSLVGEYCPGTVRLFCEGVELTNLRLQYNDNMEIFSYFPDSVPSTENSLSNPAFVSVSLTSVSKKLLVANYSVCLTADLFELQAQNIRSISCGNLDVISVKSVNITITPEQVPDTPHITAVNIIYQSGFLCKLEVTWNKTKDVCPVYSSSLRYKVILNGSNLTQIVTNYSSCEEESCNASFTNILSQSSGVYTLSLVALNNAGTSEPEVYPTDIEMLRLQYSLPIVFRNFSSESDNCRIVGYCITAVTCMVQYTTDSTYKNFSGSFIADIQFNISGLFPDTNYYFELSFIEIPGLVITNRVQITTLKQGLCNIDDYNPYLVVYIIVPVPVIVCIIIIIIVCIYKKSKTKLSRFVKNGTKLKVPPSNTENNEIDSKENGFVIIDSDSHLDLDSQLNGKNWTQVFDFMYSY